MGDEKFYEGAIKVKLEDYIPIHNFRIVGSDIKDIPGGPTELKIEISIKDTFLQKLNPYISRSGRVYGWVRMPPLLIKENDKNPIKDIELYDWTEKFLMLIVYKNSSKKKGFYISNDEVEKLLDNCLYPNH